MLSGSIKKLACWLLLAAMLPILSTAQKISLQKTSATLLEALDDIRGQSGYNIFYDAELIKNAKPVTVNVHNSSIEDALRQCFTGQPFNYRIKQHTIVITPKKADGDTRIATFRVTGRVVDEQKKPLTGVAVQVKNSQIGTLTDSTGSYAINIPDRGNYLIFSFVGFVPQEIAAERPEINITLVLRPSKLDEIVVVGYGAQRKSDVTGAISIVSGSQTVNQPARDVATLLQGRAAGVEVISNTGNPQGSTSIYIRGASSLNNPTPLYVVDGVPQGNTSYTFNTQDIASIEVLKDASASSIYGAAAAGGVVLITTKRGAKNRKPVITFNGYTGVTKPVINKLLNRDQYVTAKANIGSDITNGNPVSKLPNTNWLGAYYKNGSIQNYDLSMGGGSENSNYYVSGNYSYQTGNVIENYFKKFAVRINSDHNLGKIFKIGESVLIWNTFDRPTVSGGIFPYRSRPDMLIYDSTNVAGGGWGKAPAGFGGPNYVGLERSTRYNNDNSGVEGNIYAQLQVVRGLDARVVLGYNNISFNSTQYTGAYDFGPVKNTDPTLYKATNNTKNISLSYTLNYNWTLQKHSVRALAGFEQRVVKSSSLNGTADSLALPNATSFFVTSNANQYVGGGLDYGLIKSWFGRLNYVYDNKYIAEVSVRRDGDFYHFGPKNQYGTFPAASAAWRIGEESFIKDNLRFINDLKLRGSYGVIGNNNIPPYLFLSTFSGGGVNTGYSFSNDGSKSLSFGINRLPNAGIKWESTHETDIGIDLVMLRSSLTISADYYNKFTDGVLYNVSLPASSGIASSFVANIGKIRNRGFELLVNYKNNIGDLQYDVTVTGAFNRNRIMQLAATGNSPVYAGDNNLNSGGTYGISASQSISRSQVGGSLGEFYGLLATGVYKTDAEAANGPTINGVKPRAGDLIFKDLDHNGVIDNNDYTSTGNPNPRFNYGITLNLRYKWIDVAALFQGVSGVEIYNGRQPYNQYLFSDGNTTADIFSTSFFGANGVTGQPRVVVKDNAGNYAQDPYGNYSHVSSWWVQNGAYLKLQNLQIGFNFPKTWLSLIKASSARLFIMSSNLFTITKYKGLDPQVQALDVKYRGIDRPADYPHNRMYAIGLNCSL